MFYFFYLYGVQNYDRSLHTSYLLINDTRYFLYMHTMYKYDISLYTHDAKCHVTRVRSCTESPTRDEMEKRYCWSVSRATTTIRPNAYVKNLILYRAIYWTYSAPFSFNNEFIQVFWFSKCLNIILKNRFFSNF